MRVYNVQFVGISVFMDRLPEALVKVPESACTRLLLERFRADKNHSFRRPTRGRLRGAHTRAPTLKRAGHTSGSFPQTASDFGVTVANKIVLCRCCHRRRKRSAKCWGNI